MRGLLIVLAPLAACMSRDADLEPRVAEMASRLGAAELKLEAIERGGSRIDVQKVAQEIWKMGRAAISEASHIGSAKQPPATTSSLALSQLVTADATSPGSTETRVSWRTTSRLPE